MWDRIRLFLFYTENNLTETAFQHVIHMLSSTSHE